VSAALLDHLAADNDAGVRSAAARALADRHSPQVTAALLDRLADSSASVRRRAVGALAGRDSREVTGALLDCLAADNDASVRSAAARAFSRDPSPRALVAAASAILTLPQSCWPTLAAAMEKLMFRHYLRLEPADRAAVRVAVSQLSGAKAP
jgi:HEAT repeat protein